MTLMSMLLNIIHPYTYKVKGNSLIFGDIEEFKERDTKISSFIKLALDSNIRVMHHRDSPKNSLDGLLRDMLFEYDSFFQILFDPRIDSVTTTIYGVPLLDEKPANMSDEIWSKLKKTYTSQNELKDKTGNNKTTIFIGGILENCVINAASYHHKYHKTENEQLYYIPELCVSLESNLFNKVKLKLMEKDIKQLSYSEAIALIKSQENIAALSRI